jgi:hypothetical protein
VDIPERRSAPEITAGRAGRTFPFVRVLLYYLSLVALAAVLIALVPGFREALIAPIAVAPPSQVDELVTGGRPAAVTTPPARWTGVFGRGSLAIVAMLWALAVTLPVAWTLKHTRKLSYDPSLVQALIVLPIVVSGVVLVVKNSLALAFALAGIVAGVRFRQKLEEPEQAVYVLLALGIGLAAGVQALDIALVMSSVFTMVVLTFWRYDLGGIFAGGRGVQFTIGDPRMLVPWPSDTRREMSELKAAVAAGMDPDGMLVIRTVDPEQARRGIEVVLGRMAKHWRFGDPVADRRGGPARMEVAIELKDKADPSELIAEIEARFVEYITAAEYVPLGNMVERD